MAYLIIWSPRAAAHLEGICEYIAVDSQQYATIFAQQIMRIVRSLPSFPESGRIVPEYGDPCMREKIHGNYRLVYRIKEHAAVLEIVALCHGSRLLQPVLTDRD